MEFTTTELDQVLSNVGAQCVPTNLNRGELCDDLEWAGTWYRTGVELRASNAPRQKKLLQIDKTARRLKVLLNDDEASREIAQFYPLKAHSPKEILELLIAAVDKRLSWRPPSEPEWAKRAATQWAAELALNERSAFEWIAGQYLPGLFKKHFKKKASFSRTADGKPSGPYIRFAEHVLIELKITKHGQPYTRGAIAKALTDARAGRVRGKRGHPVT